MSELLKDLDKEFSKLKKELKLKTTLKELDDAFLINDFIMKEGYTSLRLSRQLIKRIVDVYVSWIQYLHGVILPNTSSLINLEESQYFDEEEKNELNKLMNNMMAFVSKNGQLVIQASKEQERSFIDDSITLWKKEFAPLLLKAMEKVNKGWIDRAKAAPKKKEKSTNPLSG